MGGMPPSLHLVTPWLHVKVFTENVSKLVNCNYIHNQRIWKNAEESRFKTCLVLGMLQLEFDEMKINRARSQVIRLHYVKVVLNCNLGNTTRILETGKNN